MSGGTKKRNVVPIIFALLPNKTEEKYFKLFSSIKENIQELCPILFKIDFELAAINALKTMLPAAHIFGCFFHYNQALWKNGERLGLTKVADGKKYQAMCAALAHLPSNLIAFQKAGFI